MGKTAGLENRDNGAIPPDIYTCAVGQIRGGPMPKCEVCGNEYDKAFELIAAGARHTFDSLECAIQAIAPICEHCQCRVIGHGVEVGGHFYCCAHCGRTASAADVRDRAA